MGYVHYLMQVVSCTHYFVALLPSIQRRKAKNWYEQHYVCDHHDHSLTEVQDVLDVRPKDVVHKKVPPRDGRGRGGGGDIK